MSAPFKYILAALALLVGAAGLTLLHLENQRLQRRFAADAPRVREVARLDEDNARLERLLAAQNHSAESARAQVRRDLENTRAEIAVLEQKAAQQHAVKAAMTSHASAALGTNRDPRIGLTRLEYFQNRGQATPSAALETLVWAALKGDEATLANITSLNSATRAKAETFLAELPPDARAKWTPEKLGQLWFTGLLTEVTALQIASETTVAADEAIVRLRLPNRSEEEKLTLRLTPAGWKVLAPGAAVDQLKKKLSPGK